MRSKKAYLLAFLLMAILLSATSAPPAHAYLCNPPYGFCYNLCVRDYDGFQHCMDVSFNGYFCAYISGGCYGTAYCDMCM